MEGAYKNALFGVRLRWRGRLVPLPCSLPCSAWLLRLGAPPSSSTASCSYSIPREVKTDEYFLGLNFIISTLSSRQFILTVLLQPYHGPTFSDGKYHNPHHSCWVYSTTSGTCESSPGSLCRTSCDHEYCM